MGAAKKSKKVGTTARRRRRSKKETPERAGQLRPADPFDLIRLLARSQHDPRKAVAELVQNSLDAGARRIVITRFQSRGVKTLSIRDDGEGVLPEMSRKEALAYIATNIGHSRKRHLSVEERYRLFMQGKYGIGLLGFWSVGRSMHMRTKVGDEPAYVLRLQEESPRYEIHKDRVELDLSHTWTEIVIAELHDAASRQVVGRRLADYLAEELRGQLLQREVELRVVDRLARGRAQREFRVLPPRFKGVPLPELKTLAVEGHRPARLQLHYVPPELEESGRVGLSAAGTMVVDDLAALDGLDHPPWNSGRLLGLIDFAELEVAPGSRRGFVPNAAAEALLRALALLEADLERVLGRFEEERKRETDAALLKQLQRLFRDFGRRLPSYELFEVQEESAIGGKGTGSGQGAAGAEGDAGEAGNGDGDADALIGDVGTSPQSLASQAELFLPGSLETVEIRPADVRLEPSQTRSLRAIARDASGRRLGDDVGYSWSLMHGAELARLRSEDGDEDVVLGDRVRLEAGNVPGKLIVSVTAVQGERDATAEVTVLIDETLFGGTQADLGIPEPHPVHAPGESWRSRLSDERWEYNSGHQDYLATVDDPRRKLRYVATLLAKELVLKRHQRPDSSDMLEQMVEVLSWAEHRMPR